MRTRHDKELVHRLAALEYLLDALVREQTRLVERSNHRLTVIAQNGF
jgi:hypothetical protein